MTAHVQWLVCSVTNVHARRLFVVVGGLCSGTALVTRVKSALARWNSMSEHDRRRGTGVELEDQVRRHHVPARAHV
jgi:hypothetical protein